MSNNPRIPGPSGLPILKNTHQLLRSNLLEWMPELVAEYGELVSLEVAGKSLALVGNPDIIQAVLVEKNQYFHKGGFQKMAAASLLGGGLVLSEDDRWREHRHTLEPSFGPERMSRFTEVIRKHTRRKLGGWSCGEVVDITGEMQELTLAIICDALFDVEIRNRSWKLSEAFDDVMDYFKRIGETYLYIPEKIPTPANRRYKRALNEIDNAIQDIVSQHERGHGSEESVVSVLLKKMDESDEWDHKDVRDEMVTLIVAGHETTALALSFILYLLSRNVEVQTDLRDTVRGFDEAELAYQAREAKILENVIKESLRLYPPAYTIYRQPTEDVKLGRYNVSEGTIVALPQWVLHRSPDIYETPDTFQPSRWDGDLEQKVSPGGYFPFAGGPRRCIGERFAMMELRIVVAELFREFRVETVSDEPIDVVPSLSTRPRESIQIQLK